jgi:hypothetical protein
MTFSSLVLASVISCGGETSSEPTTTINNQAPVISSTPLLQATEDNLYQYQVSASDDNSSTLIYSLVKKPEGMTISDTGLISWQPVNGVLTSGMVTVKIAENSSANALSVEQSFTINVTPVNDQLTITAITEQTVENETTFSYQITVNDVDDVNNGSDINFTLVSAPTGLTVSNTGLIEWTPSVDHSTKESVVISVSDGGEDGTVAVNFSFDLDVLFYQMISGTTINYFTGERLSSIALTVSDSESTIAQAISNATGEFTVKVLDTSLSQRMILSAQGNGFSQSSVSLSLTNYNNTQNITMLPMHTAPIFDSRSAFEVNYLNQNIVSFSANSLIREDGEIIQQPVKAQLTIIDPSIDISIMPGDMVTRQNDILVPIESFGAIDVVLTDASGAKVNLANGKQAQINIPIAANISNAPESIPLYYYDNVQGIWLKEGQANKVTVNGESFYQGNVTHFSTWNADRIYETIFINGCVIDNNTQPVANARMISIGRDYNGSSIAFSNNEGRFSVAARMNSTVLLSASQGSQSRTFSLDVSDSDTTLNDCLVLSPATSTIKLTWGEAPTDLDSHFFGPSSTDGDEFHIYYSNTEEQINDTLIYLDVDDTSSFGPEIITIPKFPLAGRYQYIIHKYSSDDGSIFSSPARIELNLESTVQIFSPPQGEPTDYWHVFDFIVNEDGTVTTETINKWLISIDDRSTASSNALPKNKSTVKNESFMTMSKKAIKQKYYRK